MKGVEVPNPDSPKSFAIGLLTHTIAKYFVAILHFSNPRNPSPAATWPRLSATARGKARCVSDADEAETMATELIPEILDLVSARDEPILTSDAFPTASFVTIKSALDRLGSREMIVYKTIDREEAILTEEAKGIAASGSHEARVFEAVRKAVDGLRLGELPVCGP